MSECPFCRCNFSSPINREAHMKLYPRHFTGEAAPQPKQEAILTTKERRKQQREKTTDENHAM